MHHDTKQDLRTRIGTAYSQIAARFAETNAAMPPALELAAAQFLALLPAGPDSAAPCLLDVGCGTGRDLGWFGAHGVSAVGLDLSHAMLDQARRRVSRAWVQADMLALPFPDARFQGVWCNAALLHLPKALAPRALTEMQRVLTRRGALFVAVKRGNGEGWVAESYGLPAPRFFAAYQPEELARFLSDAGLSLQPEGVLATGEGRWLHALAIRL